MTKKRKGRAARSDEEDDRQALPQPVDIADGIPDRAAEAPKWKYILLAAAFVAWVAFLIYCAAAGRP